LSFLGRAADVFADKTVIAYGRRRFSYSEFGTESTRLARALQASGVLPGDRVAYLCPNVPEMLIGNFGVPQAGAILVPINTSLAAEEVQHICDHSGARLLVVDTELLPALAPVLGDLRTVQEVVADRRGRAGPHTGPRAGGDRGRRSTQPHRHQPA
jgi:fatty-acyl-CoA synthase